MSLDEHLLLLSKLPGSHGLEVSNFVHLFGEFNLLLGKITYQFFVFFVIHHLLGHVHDHGNLGLVLPEEGVEFVEFLDVVRLVVVLNLELILIRSHHALMLQESFLDFIQPLDTLIVVIVAYLL